MIDLATNLSNDGVVGIDIAGCSLGADEQYPPSVSELFQVYSTMIFNTITQLIDHRGNLKMNNHRSGSYDTVVIRNNMMIFLTVFQEAARRGIHRTVHAGESSGSREVVNVSDFLMK